MPHNLRRTAAPALVLFTAFLLLSASAEAQRGALTVSRGLDQLSQEADVIVRGAITSTRVEPHPQLKNLMTVVVSMKVEETLKGSPRTRLEFRQYIWDIRDELDGARYRKGEELVLMLRPVSKYGLTSPVGLEQGRFRVVRERGQATAVNGRGNLGLFDGAEERARTRGTTLTERQAQLVRQARPGAMPLATLEEAIRSFARTK